MMVLIVERVPASLRGDLSRWLVEIGTGLFVGRVSALVREALWERAVKRAEGGSVILVWRANNEQGFDLQYHNPKGRIPIRREGVWLAEVVDINMDFEP